MQSVFDFIMAHIAIFGPIIVGILDLVFALNPLAKANGILHWIYLKISGHEPSI